MIKGAFEITRYRRPAQRHRPGSVINFEELLQTAEGQVGPTRKLHGVRVCPVPEFAHHHLLDCLEWRAGNCLRLWTELLVAGLLSKSVQIYSDGI